MLLFLLIDVAVLLSPVEAASSIGWFDDKGGTNSSSVMIMMMIMIMMMKKRTRIML